MGTQIIVTIVTGILLVAARDRDVLPPATREPPRPRHAGGVGLDHRLMGGVDGRGNRLSPRGRELVGQRGADGAKAQTAEVPKTSSSSPWHSPQTLPFLSEQEVAPQRDI
jgi:hypothetical protein